MSIDLFRTRSSKMLSRITKHVHSNYSVGPVDVVKFYLLVSFPQWILLHCLLNVLFLYCTGASWSSRFYGSWYWAKVRESQFGWWCWWFSSYSSKSSWEALNTIPKKHPEGSFYSLPGKFYAFLIRLMFGLFWVDPFSWKWAIMILLFFERGNTGWVFIHP